MRLLLCPFLFLVALVLHAQEVARPAGERAGKRQLTLEEVKKFYADEKDRITTAWIDVETSKKVWDTLRQAGYVPVIAEGKWERGVRLHRIGYKSLTDAHPDAEGIGWACYYGMKQDSFDRRAVDYRKKNYTLLQSMSFKDQDGTLYYCAVWVNPTPARQ
jgi:hypothetical protein